MLFDIEFTKQKSLKKQIKKIIIKQNNKYINSSAQQAVKSKIEKIKYHQITKNKFSKSFNFTNKQ